MSLEATIYMLFFFYVHSQCIKRRLESANHGTLHLARRIDKCLRHDYPVVHRIHTRLRNEWAAHGVARHFPKSTRFLNELPVLRVVSHIHAFWIRLHHTSWVIAWDVPAHKSVAQRDEAVFVEHFLSGVRIGIDHDVLHSLQSVVRCPDEVFSNDLISELFP